MKICVISDTHELEDDVEILPCDLLLHAGDFSFFGQSIQAMEGFNAWLGSQPARHRVITCGNHEFPIAADPAGWRRRLTNATLLLNEMVEIEGIRIWGSPTTPLDGMAFGVPDQAERDRIYAAIPTVDILMTHTPPLGILDGGQGCPALRRAVIRIRPRLHCFGHVHSAYGTRNTEHTLFVNAALLDEDGAPSRSPILINYTPRATR
jgi:Icc-related predicted phosphoesterase